MKPENGGQSSKLQQQAASAMARRKVLASYTTSNQASVERQKQIQQLRQQPRPAQTVRPAQPVQSAASQSTNIAHLKDQQTAPKISPESWKQYHTAWQDYYQKYYSNYYSNAARDYIAKAKLNDARTAEEKKETSDPKKEKEEAAAASLRTKLRAKAAKKAGKRRHHHLVPIFLGVSVTLLILFLQYNRLIFAPLMAYVSPGNAPASEIEAVDPTVTRTVSADPKLLIPKLNIDVPVHFGIQVSEVMSAMNNGVAHYRIAGADAYPGQIGNLVITGHSAGDVYSSNPYKYIFSGLERLENGDHIYINYNSVRYTYSVTKKEVIEPTNVAALIVNTDKPLLTLVTCTPLGTSKYRLLVTAEQISPAYNGETKIDEPTTVTQYEAPEVLPANEPTFFEGVWNWLTGR